MGDAKPVRRLVTGHDADGRAIFTADDSTVPAAYPGQDAAFVSIWTTATVPADNNDPVDGRERVTVPFGETAAWCLRGAISDAQGQTAWKNIAVWISSDARHLPVKLQAELPVGSFVLALRDAR